MTVINTDINAAKIYIDNGALVIEQLHWIFIDHLLFLLLQQLVGRGSVNVIRASASSDSITLIALIAPTHTPLSFALFTIAFHFHPLNS
jgi:hypothetical protein